MRAAEALETLIAAADHYIKEEGGPADPAFKERLEVATAICQAMLNTAIPVARFRLHIDTRNTDAKSRIGDVDFTVSATSIPSLKHTLKPFIKEDAQIHCTLWNQYPDRAEMLTGYQGATMHQGFRNWVRSLDAFEYEVSTVN